MDEKPPLSKKERRRRQRRLEQAQKRKERPNASEPLEANQKNSGSAKGESPPKRPGGQKRPEVTEADIEGLKYFDKLAPLLQRLHDDGCERDQAGNRNLHFDQYCMLILLYLFCPLVTSMRGILQASGLEKVQRKLGCSQVSLGSWSEAATVFDAERLKEIIRELGEELKLRPALPRGQ